MSKTYTVGTHKDLTMDQAVSLGVYGVKRRGFRPSTDMNDVMVVLKRVSQWRVSLRDHFIWRLQHAITPEESKEFGTLISMKHALFFLEPEHICQAFLETYHKLREGKY